MTQIAAPAKTNTLALIAFISAFVIPIVGFILSFIARRQLDVPGNAETGRGLARWAMIVGALGTLAQVAFFILWAVLFFGALAQAPFLR
ncbi:hypothetical protein [Streptomyces sp. AC495_CC817]|uniref:hypothetical protein n=1 Tax=Streptomyces sp. AC495_CC817 TaxID=2823900 RepID=UPI001C277792|nr:hypothetical protein [Streptomyces sp. AC495_CC817]